MIYDYYCVDCGNKLEGTQISFDLGQFLGLSTFSGSESARSKATRITAEQLKTLARNSGTELKHGQKVEITLTLRGFLDIIGQNSKDPGLRELIRTITYERESLIEVIKEMIDTGENPEVLDGLALQYYNALKSRFEPKNQETDEDKLNPAKYVSSFLIKPIFFDEGESSEIYTVEYAYDRNSPVFNRIKVPTEIRGYCPICGMPVLRETGKYPHVLVGMLGVQSAGKTSSIVAMMQELDCSCRELGLKRPDNALCDSRYKDRMDNVALYKNGWAVRKTLVETNKGTFNASLLLESDQKPVTKIVTFVDIAGEQCYDPRTEEMNATALNVYPLIGCCDLYLLCTCIDKTGYGNAEGGSPADIPAKAMVQIAKNVYDSQRDPAKVPPLCIVLTKTDMVVDAALKKESHNPFRELLVAPDNLNRKQIDNLINTYDSVQDENVRTPMEWCIDAYNEFKQRTYISMLSCSALGRGGKKYEGDMEELTPYKENGEVVPFVRTRMDDLWRWILQAIGMIDLGPKMRNPLRWVPSYGEKYIYGRHTFSEGEPVRRVYTEEEAVNRCSAVKTLFINSSPDDDSILDASNADKPFFAFGNWKQKKINQAVEDLG